MVEQSIPERTACDSPRVSIITVTRNAAEHIERTILSIRNQHYRNIEYIIIDGQSSDTTLEIIDRHGEAVDFLSSEPDKGLYDAMNKGLVAATGDYVWFMNAGDQIAHENTLECVMGNENPLHDVYYGETEYVDAEDNVLGIRSELTPHRLPASATWKCLRFGMAICHQSFIAKRDLAGRYDLRYPVTADIDWMIKILKKCRSTSNTDRILSRFLVGGFSSRHIVRAFFERFRLLAGHYGHFPNLLNHSFISARWVTFHLFRHLSH